MRYLRKFVVKRLLPMCYVIGIVIPICIGLAAIGYANISFFIIVVSSMVSFFKILFMLVDCFFLYRKLI